MSTAEHEAAIGRLLAELGGTADKVADTLRTKEIRGVRGEPWGCPIARYIRAQEPLITRVVVSRGRTLFVDPFAAPYRRIRVNNPVSVAEFVRRFDEGVYLDLVEVGG